MGFQVYAYLSWVLLLLTIISVLAARAEAAGEECGVKRCSQHAPEIRFPFWLQDQQPEHCGYPGFRVSCHEGKTLLHLEDLANTSLQGIQLFFSKEVPILSISYKFQEIDLSQSANNLKLVSTSTLSPAAIAHPLGGIGYYNVTFFSCSSRVVSFFSPVMLTSLSEQAFPVYYLEDFTSIKPSVTSCTKLFNSSLPVDLLYEGRIALDWSTPNCKICEAKGKYCKLLKNSTNSNIGTADNNITCLSKGMFIIPTYFQVMRN